MSGYIKNNGGGGGGYDLRERKTRSLGVVKTIGKSSSGDGNIISKSTKKSKKLLQYKEAITDSGSGNGGDTIAPTTTTATNTITNIGSTLALPIKQIAKIDNINENISLTNLIELERNVLEFEKSQRRINIFAAATANMHHFIVAFVHPANKMFYRITTEYKMELYCNNVNARLLYKNDVEMTINRPRVSAFKVQLNASTTTRNIDIIEYNASKSQLKLTFSPNSNDELFIKKCIVYFDILNYDDRTWQVPRKMKNLFSRLDLDAPTEIATSEA
ncbi:ORF-22 [Catopsilia pomona nucleopolyhedrovirus]|uniref:ORF-22 n=1 Tax=Catopsilia pomona nucleopolyhedrovirus TaxID=1850906 RepID=A0A172WZ96_9ABAC|nr:ORF-22 [Catopsilia pomona nucleopolyhedrovirus]ANF29670.1 ORF-22 [Catopsilia pomona nucleopolyhedrovirus]